MTTYLYNGTPLPALPESVYPHACIIQDAESGDVNLYFTDMKMYRNTLGHIWTGTQPPGNYEKYTVDSNAFVLAETGSIDPANGETLFFAGIDYTLIWANTDIYRSGSSEVYRPADADPVPVSAIPVPPPDPLSMLLGWRVGSAVRSMRR